MLSDSFYRLKKEKEEIESEKSEHIESLESKVKQQCSQINHFEAKIKLSKHNVRDIQ